MFFTRGIWGDLARDFWRIRPCVVGIGYNEVPHGGGSHRVTDASRIKAGLTGAGIGLDDLGPYKVEEL